MLELAPAEFPEDPALAGLPCAHEEHRLASGRILPLLEHCEHIPVHAVLRADGAGKE